MYNSAIFFAASSASVYIYKTPNFEYNPVEIKISSYDREIEKSSLDTTCRKNFQ